eukprot:5216413-Amphidinium_carterae.1
MFCLLHGVLKECVRHQTLLNRAPPRTCRPLGWSTLYLNDDVTGRPGVDTSPDLERNGCNM